MKKIFAALALLSFASFSARAGIFGRNKFDARWAGKPLAVEADDADWVVSSAFEEDGLSVMAMNDASSLYLLVTAHTREAREQLNGESRQDVTFWFVGADGKTRDWGARLPFSRRPPLTAALRDPAGVDPEPEFVRYQGVAVSSESLPGDVVDRLAAAGRRPIWELKIPLKRLTVTRENGVAIDFVLNAPAGGAKRRPVGEKEGAPPAAGGRRDRNDADAHPEELVWNALSYTLFLRLAPDPALPR